MKIVELNIDHTTPPQKLADILWQHNLGQGDKLSVTTSLQVQMVLLIVSVALFILRRNNIGHTTDKVLNDIFSDKDSKEIQKEIASEYGIEVEVKTKEYDEQSNWAQFSKDKLSKAYGADEPEYELSMVKEPNPGYRK